VIFSPNDIFNDYISGVLPELGENNVYQTTFMDYARNSFKSYLKIEDANEQMEYMLSAKKDAHYYLRKDNISFKTTVLFAEIIKRYINYYLAVIFPVILIYFFGSKINNGTSISLLQSKGINCGEYGVFQYNESGNFINTYLRHIESYSLYIIPVIIGFIILNLYFKYYKINYKWKQILIILFLYSLPLFYFANDWGRWINIHFTLITIILLTYFSRKKVIFPPYFIYFIPLMLVWGYSILEKGFHFNTYLNYLVLNKILHLNYSFY